MRFRPVFLIVMSLLGAFASQSPIMGQPVVIDSIVPRFSDVLELSWAGGASPFAVEKRDSLSLNRWNPLVVTANRTAYVDRSKWSGFFRITTVNVLPTWVREYEAFLSARFRSDRIPGMALALVEGANIVFAKGYGLRDVEADLPVNRDTLFHVGSSHKPMTSAMIGTLVDNGVLEWDTPVTDVWSDFTLHGSNASSVSIRHLLSMRSGIPDSAEDDLEPGLEDPEELFDFVSEVDPIAGPGEKFSYSNISVSIAGYVGALADGGNQQTLFRRYEALFQERILDPLGMRRATLSAEQSARDENKSKAYIFINGQAVLAESEDQEGDILAPSGGLKASASEMASFIIMQIKRGIAPNGKRVLGDDNTVECWKPYVENYGMGWETVVSDGERLLYHDGSFDNFVSVIAFLPETKRGYVLLINSEDAGSDLIETSIGEFHRIAREEP